MVPGGSGCSRADCGFGWERHGEVGLCGLLLVSALGMARDMVRDWLGGSGGLTAESSGRIARPFVHKCNATAWLWAFCQEAVHSCLDTLDCKFCRAGNRYLQLSPSIIKVTD